jgi:hypothetical protein
MHSVLRGDCSHIAVIQTLARKIAIAALHERWIDDQPAAVECCNTSRVQLATEVVARIALDLDLIAVGHGIVRHVNQLRRRRTLHFQIQLQTVSELMPGHL